MDSKKSIQRAISLAVLSALVQNNQIDGLRLRNFKPSRIAKMFKNKALKCGVAAFEFYKGSALGDGSKPSEGLFALAHKPNSCWIDMAVSAVSSQLNEADIQKIENKLGELEEENKSKKDGWTDLGEFESQTLLRLFIQNIKEVRAQKREKISEPLQNACNYRYNKGGDPQTLFKKLIPALKSCGFTALLTYDIEKIKAWGYKKYVVAIQGEEPHGKPHIYCIYVDEENQTYREINDMNGLSYKGYVHDLDPEAAKQKISYSPLCAYAIAREDSVAEPKKTPKEKELEEQLQLLFKQFKRTH